MEALGLNGPYGDHPDGIVSAVNVSEEVKVHAVRGYLLSNRLCTDLLTKLGLQLTTPDTHSRDSIDLIKESDAEFIRVESCDDFGALLDNDNECYDCFLDEFQSPKASKAHQLPITMEPDCMEAELS